MNAKIVARHQGEVNISSGVLELFRGAKSIPMSVFCFLLSAFVSCFLLSTPCFIPKMPPMKISSLSFYVSLMMMPLASQLHAAAIDTTGPRVVIREPAAGALLTNQNVTFRGTALDRSGVTNVSFQILTNNAAAALTNPPVLSATNLPGTTNWTNATSLQHQLGGPRV